MTQRAHIRQTSPRTVALTYTSQYSDARITREFSVPHSGGCIRDDSERQVCAELDSRGWALYATPETLLATIRREWSRARRRTPAWAR